MTCDRMVLPASDDALAARLERVRASGRPLLDLTEQDPGRCGLGWDPEELDTILDEARARVAATGQLTDAPAREAVASYLAGLGVSVAPERIALTPSRAASLGLVLEALCPGGGEVLVPSPAGPWAETIAARSSVGVRRYALAYDGEWRLDRTSIVRAASPDARAVVVGNPSEPTGAALSRDDLTFLERFCVGRGLAMIGDEGLAETLPAPRASVLDAQRCLSFHLSGLAGLCGLPRLESEWLAIAGSDELAGPALERLGSADGLLPPAPRTLAYLAIPALLARRERFLGPLRARLAQNLTALATAALREAPWSVMRAHGGRWAVLEIGAAEAEEAMCLALLEDGVVVQPGSYAGLPGDGYLIVSLLTSPETFREGLARLDRRLRAPLTR